MIRALYSFFGRDVERRAQRHAELLASLPKGTDTNALESLLRDELAEVTRQGRTRLGRRVDWLTVVTMVVVTVGAGALTWVLWTAPAYFDWPPWGRVASRVTAILAGIFGGLLVMAGAGSFYKTDEPGTDDGT